MDSKLYLVVNLAWEFEGFSKKKTHLNHSKHVLAACLFMHVVLLYFGQQFTMSPGWPQTCTDFPVLGS